MEKLEFMRLGAILIVAAVSFFMPKLFSDLVIIMSLSHYLIAAIYSKNYYGFGTKKPVAVILLAVAGVILYKLMIPITLIFGIHYVFTEVYLSHAAIPSLLKSKTKPLRIAALAFNFFIYLSILRNDAYFPIFNTFGQQLLVATALGGIFYYGTLMRTRRYLTNRQIINVSLVENLSVGLLLLSLFVPLNLFYFIGCHVVFWSIYPIPGLAKKHALIPYLTLTLSTLLLFSMLSPMVTGIFSSAVWLKLFIVSGLIHITMSLALTKAQPGWITKIFDIGSTNTVAAGDDVKTLVTTNK